MRKALVVGLTMFGMPAGVWPLPSAAAQEPGHSPLEAEFPKGTGKQLVMNACQRCHTLDRIYESDLWTYQWRDTVQDMVRRGAALEGDDIETVVLYLGKNFRPSGPVRARVNLPDGEGKAIVAGDCQKCHSLRKIVPMRLNAADWNTLVHAMIYQGAKVRDEDVDIIVQYLVKNFGPATP